MDDLKSIPIHNTRSPKIRQEFPRSVRRLDARFSEQDLLLKPCFRIDCNTHRIPVLRAAKIFRTIPFLTARGKNHDLSLRLRRDGPDRNDAVS